MAELVREIMIDARPETIWPFLTDPEKHVEWNGTKADIDPKPGGTYRVLVAGQYPSAGEYVEGGWEQEGNPVQPGSTTVEITLQPEGDKTRVRLVHRDLPAEAVGNHRHGWSHYLQRLAVGATGGDPGPDQGPEWAA